MAAEIQKASISAGAAAAAASAATTTAAAAPAASGRAIGSGEVPERPTWPSTNPFGYNEIDL